MMYPKLFLVQAFAVSVTALTIQEVPQCAQTCLSKSTQEQSTCQFLDVACLCVNTAYVTSVSCCLATNCTTSEQIIAIQFNQQECGKVNATAPNFVGCAPIAVSSTVVLGGNGETTTSSVMVASTTRTTTFPTTTDLALTFISGSVITEPPTLSTRHPSTLSFAGKPLLTGNCSIPYFAIVTDSDGRATQYPAVGCGAKREYCCPSEPGINGVLTQCPQDYFTTAGGCCPYGYQVGTTNLGPATSCYSMASKTLLPFPLPTQGGVELIGNRTFAQKFALAKPAKSTKLPLGAIVGLVVGVVLFLVLVTAIIWYRRRKVGNYIRNKEGTTFPATEPILDTSMVRVVQELPSPDYPDHRPNRRAADWPILPVSSPPSYDYKPGNATGPQELPGSTFINEHHPAHSTHSPSSTSPPTTPKTPTRSGRGGEKPSPVITPLSSIGARSPLIVSPLASPRLPRDTT